MAAGRLELPDERFIVLRRLAIGRQRVAVVAQLLVHEGAGIGHLLQPGREQGAAMQGVQGLQGEAVLLTLGRRDRELIQGLIRDGAI